jgi:xanthine dehydrogenase accessory factor
MRTLDHQVIQACRHWLDSGTQTWLCTIVRTVGSSPRPVGSLLAFAADGTQVGSLSGGCVEDDLLQRVRAGEFSDALPCVVEYGLVAEDNERLGLPCGGRLEVLVEHVGAGGLTSENIAALLAALEERRCVVRHLDLDTATSSLATVEAFLPLTFDGLRLSHCLGPQMRMLLVGAGQLAQSLSELALAMDYEVLVTDPRPEVLAQWAGPEVRLLGGMPDDVVRDNAGDSHSMIITLTHDPRIDDMALMEALTTQAWYVGALGSKRTTQKRLRRLRELELSEAQVGRLYAPVGLDIGSKTPMEIAVSIMAQLTQLRHRR